MSLKKVHFLNSLLEENIILDAYKSLNYEFNDNFFYASEEFNKTTENDKTTVTTYIAFPKFLKPTFDNSKIFNAKTIIQKNQNCFGIIINPDIKNISQYINKQFSKNSKAPILKKIKRLETCFNIRYQVYFGNIEKEYYDYLMNRTHAMIIKRFEQRNDTNFILNNWDKYNTILYSLINKKKASIFVIYNNENPIQVSINFHYNQTFFAFIPAYNIDYSQFGLGNTAVYKQLEWCIENNYEYLDMGNGDLEYKQRWCNHGYSLETHVYYKKKSIIANLIAFKEINKVIIINFLKDLKNASITKKILHQKTHNNFRTPEYIVEEVSNVSVYKNENLIEIDIKANTVFKYLNKPIYDHLYTQQEHFDSIKLYKIVEEKNSFLLKSTKPVKITLLKTNSTYETQ